ncbi:enhanced intracellular survival protein Eis [Virgibacillus kekensis]|uniref:Enhanced intracellular survival protein Eis n=1 Tax=Virgibacillus kekensis TaxID=202261 RepID=A0ABV9DLT4_9BACI
MKKQIRKLTEKEYDDFAILANGAYPGLNAEKWLAAHINVSPDENLHGVYASDKLVAGMRTFDFRMNFNGTEIAAGGVGMIAVDLLHKKERNAYQLMQYFLKEYDESGTNIVMLNPFKVTFYRKMGFGMGTKSYQFHMHPREFINFRAKEHLKELSIEDREKVRECYNRIYAITHGMTRRPNTERELGRPFQFGRVIGYIEDGNLKGYMVFSSEEEELHIHELFFETPLVMKEFSTFLHSQADQFSNVIINSNHDDIIHMVNSPESKETPMTDFPSNVEPKHIAHLGAGVMFRIINGQRFFKDLMEKGHRFGRETVSLKLSITDEFFPQNSSAIIIDVVKGTLKEVRNEGIYDVELKINVSEFSSLVMGAVNLRTLQKWGLSELSESSYVRTLTSLFSTDNLPVVTKAF